MRKVRWIRFGTSKRAALAAVAALVCILTLAVGPAWALRYYATYNAEPQVFNDNNFHNLDHGIDIKGQAVGTDWIVTTIKKSEVQFFFSAECAVDANDNNTWLGLAIVVDGTTIPPTDSSGFTFCTSHGTGTLDTWASYATHGTVELDPGNHTVQVQVRPVSVGAGEQVRLDDTSLMVNVRKR